MWHILPLPLLFNVWFWIYIEMLKRLDHMIETQYNHSREPQMQNMAAEMGLEIYLKVTGEYNFFLGKW